MMSSWIVLHLFPQRQEYQHTHQEFTNLSDRIHSIPCATSEPHFGILARKTAAFE